MARTTTLIVGAGLLGLASCATMAFRGVDDVVADVRRDEVAAAVTWQDKLVGLQGRVEAKGLTAEKVATTNGGFGGPLWWLGGNVVLEDKNLAYVTLAGADQRSGKLVCLFESWAFEPLAKVRQDETVQVVCEFYKIEGQAPSRVPVFHNCSVGKDRARR